eukprot:9447646-Karenia_brevis.AAC.1
MKQSRGMLPQLVNDTANMCEVPTYMEHLLVRESVSAGLCKPLLYGWSPIFCTTARSNLCEGIGPLDLWLQSMVQCIYATACPCMDGSIVMPWYESNLKQ